MTRPAALLLGLAWLGLAGACRAQDEPAPDVRLHPNGTQLFRALLDFAGVKPITSIEGGRGSDNVNRIVVVFGKPDDRRAREIGVETREVLRWGGAVLIVSDQEIDLRPNYLPGVATSAWVLPAIVRHPGQGFNNLDDCPFVTSEFSQTPPVVTTPNQNPFAGLHKVATNRPGVLLIDNGITQFARFRDGKIIRFKQGGVGAGGYPQIFAGGQELQTFKSRWIAIADDDALKNGLLAAKGTDNFVLAYQLVQWLRGPEGRSECLFYEYGKRIDKFDEVKFVTVPDLPGPPIPSIPPLKVIEEQLTDFGNKVVDDVQTNDVLHNKLVGDDVGYARWLRLLAVAAAAVAAVFLLRRAFAARQPAPGPVTVTTDDGPPGKLLAVLRQEMVRGNNFTPAVTAYIEETFRLAGLSAGPHAEMPPVAVTGKKVKKVQLMSDIQALWRVAYGPPGRPVHYAVWKELEPAVEHVRRLAVKGRWHFAPDFVPSGGAA